MADEPGPWTDRVGLALAVALASAGIAFGATFRGPRRVFYRFDARKIKVAIDVSMAEVGRRTFNISEQNIRYPKELTLQDVTPSTLKLSVKKAPIPEETNRG